MDFETIATANALQGVCERLASAPWVALDTEFMRESTYYPKLCLLQLATPDWAACVDPLAGVDLAPVYEALYREDLLKVFHAAGQDLEIFHHLHGRLPVPLFDTQLAAPVLGYGEQIGYGNLVDEVLGEKLDKAHSRADWSHRPLSEAQLRYAADDVIYLARLYPLLRERLEKLGRLDWLADDFAALGDPSRYVMEPEQAWLRIKGADRYRGSQLAVLQALAAWRESEARLRDRPRGWLLRDDALLDIARHQPASLSALGRVRGVQERMLNQYGDQLMELVQTARQRKPDTSRRPVRTERLSPLQEAEADMLMAVVRLRAQENSLHPSVLASRRDLTRLVLGEAECPLLQGWRRELIGRELLAVLEGELRLRLDGGMLRIESAAPHQ